MTVVNGIDTSAPRKNKEWQDKLLVVLKAEEILYSKASSKTFDEVKVDVGGDMLGCTQGISENAGTGQKVGEDVSVIVRKVTERCFKVPDLGLRFVDWARIKNGPFVGEAKSYKFVEGLCEEMERLKDRNMRKAGFEPDVAVYKVMLRTLCKEMVSKEMEPDISLYKLILDYLARPGDVDTIYLVANAMINISEIPEGDVYTYMLKSFCTS
ncbi:putative pentatricopeptide repeat-containing protein, partial [Tanacetum coccineum]